MVTLRQLISVLFFRFGWQVPLVTGRRVGHPVRFVMSRRLLTHHLLSLGVFPIVGEILPFLAMTLVIVKLLGAIGVGDVAIALRRETIVIVAKDRQRGLVPIGFRIFQQGGEVILLQS